MTKAPNFSGLDLSALAVVLPHKIALVLGVLVVASVLTSASGANADWRQLAPWCANMGGSYGFDCSYFTFEQCMATARGLGNFCSPNPSLQPGSRPIRQQRRVRNY
jgi:Protein of unknown function (DUF3551)